MGLLLVAALGSAPLVALWWLRGAPGEAALRAQVLSAVNGALEGRLELDAVHIDGEEVHLEGLRLLTPDGVLVAEVATLDARLRLLELVRQRVRLEAVRIGAPRVLLVEDAQGLTLARATRPRPTPAGPPTAWVVSVRDLELERGRIELHAGGRDAVLGGLRITGGAELALGSLVFTGALEARGQLQGPLEAAVAISSKADELGASASLAVGDSSLQAWRTHRGGALRAERLDLRPETLGALVPGWPLRVPLTGEAEASDTGARLALRAGAGVALTVDARWEAGPEGTAARLQPLRLVVPGATLTVEGTASAAALDLAGRLQAQDLAAVAGAVKELTGLQLPALAGSGQLELGLRGPSARPAATLAGALAQVRVAGLAARTLELELSLPELTRPLGVRARAHAQALSVSGQSLEDATLVVAALGRDLEADLTTTGLGDARLHLAAGLDASGEGATVRALRLTATGLDWTLEAPARVAWAPGHARVEPLTLRDGDQRLALAVEQDGRRLQARLQVWGLDLARLPAVLSPPALRLSGLVSLDLAVDGAQPWPDATLELGWRGGTLAGVEAVELEVAAAWRQARLLGTATGSSAQGDLEATYELPLLATGSEPLSASVRLSGLDPARLGPLLGVALPLEGVLSLQVLAAGTAGAPALEAALTSPALVVLVGGARLPLEAARLEVRTADGGALGAEASARGLGGVARATVASDFTLPGLRAHLPALAALEAAPLTATLEASDLDLGQLATLGLATPEGLTGRVAASGAVSGTLAEPRGTIRLSASPGALPPLRPVEATLTLTAGAGRTALEAEMHQAGQPVATLTATLAAEVRELLGVRCGSPAPGPAAAARVVASAVQVAGAPSAGPGAPSRPCAALAALGSRAIAVAVTVLPTPLDALLEGTDGGAGPTGSLSGSLALSGTLGAPALRLAGAVEGLHLEEAALGDAHLEAEGDGRSQRVSVRLEAGADAGLSLAGTLGLPLGLHAAADPAAWSAAPLALALDASALDVSFLSGVHPLVRIVSGRLSSRATLGGTLGAPAFSGQASWSDGRLALTGLGEFHHIEAALTATEALVELTTLELLAGDGRASVTGRLRRTGPGRSRLDVEGTLDQLPIVADDQLLASATADFTVAGEVTPGLIDVTSITASRVEVVLPNARRRDVQDLERPLDLVVLGPGGRAERLRLEARRATSQAAASGPTLRAVLDLPGNVWLKSADIDVELGLSPGFRMELNPRFELFGEVGVLRGQASVIGRTFVVQPGAWVRFAGAPAQPLVDVAARYTNEREQVQVTVGVAGRGSAVALHVTSEPALPENDIYTLLATGRRQLRRGSGAALGAEDTVSVLGQLAATELRTKLARNLPIDVLGFESADNFANLKFDVGKYLSDWLYIGVSAQTGANPLHGENPWAGRVELRLSKQWNLEAYGGTAPAAGLDVVWSTDF